MKGVQGWQITTINKLVTGVELPDIILTLCSLADTPSNNTQAFRTEAEEDPEQQVGSMSMTSL